MQLVRLTDDSVVIDMEGLSIEELEDNYGNVADVVFIDHWDGDMTMFPTDRALRPERD